MYTVSTTRFSHVIDVITLAGGNARYVPSAAVGVRQYVSTFYHPIGKHSLLFIYGTAIPMSSTMGAE